MKTSIKCVGCFFRQIEKTAAHAGLKGKPYAQALGCLTQTLLRHDFNDPPVVFGRAIYKVISRYSGKSDIFAGEKHAVEAYLGRYAQYIEKILNRSKEPLHLAAQMSCASNSIDFGAGSHRPDIAGLVKKLTRIRLTVDDFPYFSCALKKAGSVLFVADNCGETFFDKFFIEQIRLFKPDVDIFYAVRSAPMINDATLDDARRLGLHKAARLFSSGCDYPGLILEKASPYFKDLS